MVFLIEFIHAIQRHWPRPSCVRVYKIVNIDRIFIFTPLLVFNTGAILASQQHGKLRYFFLSKTILFFDHTENPNDRISLMDPIESKFASEYERFTKRNRYDTRNIARKLSRWKRDELLSPNSCPSDENRSSVDHRRMNDVPHQINEIENCIIHNVKSDEIIITDLLRPPNDDGKDRSDSNISACGVEGDVTSVEDDESSTENLLLPTKTYLHDHTIYSTNDYCAMFMDLSRKAKLCKSNVNDFLSFIKSGLPVPNNLPSTEKQLLALLDVEDLFTKRSICLSCYDEINYRQTTCHRCNTGTTRVAHL